MRRAMVLVAGLCALAVAVAGCGGSSGSGGSGSGGSGPKVTLAVSQPIGQLLLPFLAASQGDFSKAGVDVSVKFVPSAELLPAIASGSVQLAVSTAPQLDLTSLKAPVKLIGQWAPHADIQFVAAPGIRSATDLKGKTISASSPGSASYVLTRKLLKDAGVSVGAVHQQVLPSAAELAPAFKRGSIDGSTVGPPLTAEFLALRPGATVLANFSSTTFTGSELAAYMPWAKAHGTQATAIVKALNEALTQWRSDPSAAEGVIAKETGVPAKAAMATYQATMSVFTSHVEPVTLPMERSVLSIVSSVYDPTAKPSRAAQVVTSAYTG